MAIAAGAPSTRHWCVLSSVVSQFGAELVLENVADLQGLLGAKRYRTFFRDGMGAVEYEIKGKKELFIPGSKSDYPQKDMAAFLNDLNTVVDVRVLMASRDDSEQSRALVREHGGRGAVGKSLLQFRANLPASGCYRGGYSRAATAHAMNSCLLASRAHSCPVVSRVARGLRCDRRCMPASLRGD